jgi:Ca2+-binding RTX toxin-like protein
VIGGNDGDVVDSGVRGEYDYGALKVISINFNSETDKGMVTGTAGAVAVDNWNNLPSDGKGSVSGLVADDGGATSVNAQWGEEVYSKKSGYQLSGTAEQESNDQLYPDTQNESLFEGSLEVDHKTLGVDLSGLGGLGVYDVYVYFSNDDADNHDHEHDVVKISAGDTSYYVEQGATFDGNFVDASSMDRCAPGRGNYVVFRGLTLDQLSIRLSGDDWIGHHHDGEASIAGIQIVSGAGRTQAIDVAAGRIGGDFDKDLVFGDNATVHWFGGKIYEALATDPVATAGGSTFQSDTITSGVGADIVVGGNGADFIAGGEGHDLLVGDNARLLFFKGEVIGLGDDGNPGNWDYDHYDYSNKNSAHFNEIEACGIQLLNPTIGGNDVIEGGKGDDLMFGQFGNDTYVFAGGGLGRDYIVEAGCNGPNDLHDRLDFSQFAGSVNIDLGDSCQQTINCGTQGGDINLKLTLLRGDSIEDVTGSEFADCIEGNNRNNILIGRAGADHIQGEGGDDVILGMDGNDELSGGYGEDMIDGGAGNDRIFGGRGDRDFSHKFDNDGNWWKPVYGADILLGGSGDDQIWGNQGNDLIDGEDGNDYLDGDSGNDIVIGGNGNDYLIGGSGKDMLEGGAGNDTLKSDKSDLLVVQETKAGQLGLNMFFQCFAPQFSQDGFSYQDPSGGNPNLDDRPARAWVALYSAALPGSGNLVQAINPASTNVCKSDFDSPAIDWSGKFFDNTGLPKTSSSAWLEDFVNHLGQNEAQRNPNASLRVQITA